jgi:hypothetical protein
MRRRIVTTLRGETVCDECGTTFDDDRCPTCAQRRRRRAGLESVFETYAGNRVWVTVERADADDGDGWWPTQARDLDDQVDDEPGGWPW